MKRYTILYETENSYIKEDEISNQDKTDIIKMARQNTRGLAFDGTDRASYLNALRAIKDDEANLEVFINSDDINKHTAAIFYKNEKSKILQNYRDTAAEFEARWPTKNDADTTKN